MMGIVSGFVALDNVQTGPNGEQVTLDQQARANAKLIADKIMNQLSYGSEFALLDDIFFSPDIGDSEEISAAGIYSYESEMAFEKNNGQENNTRIIEIKMEEPTTLEADGTIDAIQYLDNILYTFAHEYGHHLTMYNNRFKEPNSFLDELKKVFSDNAVDFSDFEKIYKYFNNLNDDSRKNYAAWESRYGESEDDQQIIIDTRNEILRLYRMKYARNIMSLINEFPERIYGYPNNVAQIINKLNLWKGRVDIQYNTSTFATNFKTRINDVLEKDENGQITGTGIINDKYEEFRQYLTDSPIYLFYIDYDQIFEAENGSFGRHYYFLPASYNQVVTSPTFNPNGQNGATIGDIFGNDIDIDNVINPDGFYDTTISTKDNACSSLPLTFGSINHKSYDAEYFLNEINSIEYDNKTYSELSEIHDDEIMKKLSYYYSKNELLARLYATLTFRYEKKVPLTACAFYSGYDSVYGGLNWRPRDIGAKRQFYPDYSLFKAWGMDILSWRKC